MIIQILDTLSYGDAVSNHALGISKILDKNEIENKIYANCVDSRLSDIAKKIDTYTNKKDDIVIYHLSSGCAIADLISSYDCIKGIDYHNITPACYMHNYNKRLERVANKGREDLYNLRNVVNFAWADSDYNASELEQIGYKCKIDTVPIIMDYNEYKINPEKSILDKYDDHGWVTNIIFVGRIAPNKKQEDVIYDFYYYKKYYNNNSRLFLVGNYNHFEKYYLKLQKLVNKLNLETSIIFTGHVKFSEIIAYYKLADLFLCESSHEGFCVPLIESMLFDIPIVAYNSSAVGETMGDGGVLIDDKDPCKTAAVVDTVINDSNIRAIISSEQKKRLDQFSVHMTEKKLINLLYSLGGCCEVYY